MKTQVFQLKSEFIHTKAQFARKVLTQRHGGTEKIKEIFFYTLFSFVLLMGCDLNLHHEDSGFIPVGEWTGIDWGAGHDKYIITNTKITYIDPWNTNNFSGTIITANDFSNDAGVIIIQILDNPTPDAYSPNKYTCVYYRNYSSSYISLAPPLDVSFNYIEADTLNEAKSIFTLDNISDHVGAWGSYTK